MYRTTQEQPEAAQLKLDISRFAPKKQKHQPKCPWQYAIDEVIRFMGPGRSRGFWMRYCTQHFKIKDSKKLAYAILGLIQECKHAKKGQGMFYNKVVKGL